MSVGLSLRRRVGGIIDSRRGFSGSVQRIFSQCASSALASSEQRATSKMGAGALVGLVVMGALVLAITLAFTGIAFYQATLTADFCQRLCAPSPSATPPHLDQVFTSTVSLSLSLSTLILISFLTTLFLANIWSISRCINNRPFERMRFIPHVAVAKIEYDYNSFSVLIV